MQQYIRLITARLIAQLLDEQAYYSPPELEKAGFPSFLVERIRLELERNLAESVVLPDSDWADMQADPVIDAWDHFLLAIRAETRIPHSFVQSVVENAVEDVLDLMSEPQRAVLDTLFRSAKSATPDELEARRKWITINGYLAVALLRYIRKKDIGLITREKAAGVLRQVDHSLTGTHTPLKWGQMFDAWYVLFGDMIPSVLVARFFADKGLASLAKRFSGADENLSRPRLIEYLSMPDFGWDEDEEEDLKAEADSGKSPATDDERNSGEVLSEDGDVRKSVAATGSILAMNLPKSGQFSEMADEDKAADDGEFDEAAGGNPDAAETADANDNVFDFETDSPDESEFIEDRESDSKTPDFFAKQSAIESESGAGSTDDFESIEVSDSVETFGSEKDSDFDEVSSSKEDFDFGHVSDSEETTGSEKVSYFEKVSDSEEFSDLAEVSSSKEVSDFDDGTDSDDPDDTESQNYTGSDTDSDEAVPIWQRFVSEEDGNENEHENESIIGLDDDSGGNSLFAQTLSADGDIQENPDSDESGVLAASEEQVDSDELYKTLSSAEEDSSDSLSGADGGDYAEDDTVASDDGIRPDLQDLDEEIPEAGVDEMARDATKHDVLAMYSNGSDDEGNQVIELSDEAKILLSYLAAQKDVYIEEIFRNDEAAFYSNLNEISQFGSWQTAGRFVTRDIFTRNRVDLYSDAAVGFTDQLQQFFEEKESSGG